MLFVFQLAVNKSTESFLAIQNLILKKLLKNNKAKINKLKQKFANLLVTIRFYHFQS